MKKVLVLTAGLLLAASTAFAQLGTTSPSGTLALNVAAEAGLVVNTATTTLTESGANFQPYTGTTGLTYFIRTSSSGTGTIGLRVSTDFGPSGGPSVGTPPTTSDALTYVPTISSPGTAVAGQTASTSSTLTPVANFGNNAHSTYAGNSASIAWSLTNDPLYAVGAYTATITYTISAT
ncbi:MAG: hypothetical protein ACLQVG_25545 [Terriglobia bacterium]